MTTNEKGSGTQQSEGSSAHRSSVSTGNVLENSTMPVTTLQVPAGVDMIDWVKQFVQSRNVSITILAGYGLIKEATLKHIGSHVEPKTHSENFTLITFSGSCLFSTSGEAYSGNYFNATLSKIDGHVIGGAALKMITLGRVVLNAIIHSDPVQVINVGFGSD